MKKLQGLCGTALAYSIARTFIDKDPQMQWVWKLFASIFGSVLLLTYLYSWWKSSRESNEPIPDRRTSAFVLNTTNSPLPAAAHVAAVSTNLPAANARPSRLAPVVSNSDRERLQVLIAELAEKTGNITINESAEWDKRLREFFRDSQDPHVRETAFKLWDALWATWIEGLEKEGNTEEAQRLAEFIGTYRTKFLEIERAKRIVAHPDFPNNVLIQ